VLTAQRASSQQSSRTPPLLQPSRKVESGNAEPFTVPRTSWELTVPTPSVPPVHEHKTSAYPLHDLQALSTSSAHVKARVWTVPFGRFSVPCRGLQTKYSTTGSFDQAFFSQHKMVAQQGRPLRWKVRVEHQWKVRRTVNPCVDPDPLGPGGLTVGCHKYSHMVRAAPLYWTN